MYAGRGERQIGINTHLEGMRMAEKDQHLTWPQAAADFFDVLTGRKTEVTYTFDSLEIHVPVESGAQTEHAIWKLNGAVRIHAREEVRA